MVLHSEKCILIPVLKGFFLMQKIAPSITGCLGHLAEPSVAASLGLCQVHMENTAERTTLTTLWPFIRLTFSVFGHTDNTDGVFKATITDVLILNKELLRAWCKSSVVFQAIPGLSGMKMNSFKDKLQNNCKKKSFCLLYCLWCRNMALT